MQEQANTTTAIPADESLSHRLFPNEDIHAVDQAEWVDQSR
jgi:hypothetical protein